jgi:hypothetical protein
VLDRTPRSAGDAEERPEVNQRQATRIAHRIAYRFCQQALDVGGSEFQEYVDATAADQKKIDDALDRITQRHFELAHIDPEPK